MATVIYPPTSSAGTGDIPSGDTLRVGTDTTVNNSDTTVLPLSSATVGFLQGFWVRQLSTSASDYISTIKVTVDGASERTLTVRMGYDVATNAGVFWNMFIPLQIKFTDSLVVKMAANNGGRISAQAVYDVE